MTRARIVTIFTKPQCGLCEEAEEAIEAVRARREFELVRRNILENVADYERYKHDIPVILVDGVEIARHHLSEDLLTSALNATPSPRRTGARELTIVMAKYPTPGAVKTRLMPALTADHAARLHREFLLHVVNRLAPRRLIVCFDPPDSEAAMRQLLGVDLTPQSPGDLGHRLAVATAAARHAAETVIFLGTDSPDVPLRYIDRIAELITKHDLVIAPAEDGGFWSVALAPRIDPEKLFIGIDWSTGREGAQTLERAKHLGYNVALADRWADVDRPDDLRRLIERLKRSDDPDNQKLLARLSFLPPDAECDA